VLSGVDISSTIQGQKKLAIRPTDTPR
jgi:hypothetical protein